MNFQDIHRRTFLARSGLNVGAAALSTLFARDALSSPTALLCNSRQALERSIHFTISHGRSQSFFCVWLEVRVISKRLTTNQFWLNKMVNQCQQALRQDSQLHSYRARSLSVWGHASLFDDLVSVVQRLVSTLLNLAVWLTGSRSFEA